MEKKYCFIIEWNTGDYMWDNDPDYEDFFGTWKELEAHLGDSFDECKRAEILAGKTVYDPTEENYCVSYNPENMSNITMVIDEIEKRALQKIKNLRENQNAIEYLYSEFEWKTLTEEIAEKILECDDFDLENFVVNKHFLVKTDNGIEIVKEVSNTMQVLYDGTYEQCKDFIKIK